MNFSFCLGKCRRSHKMNESNPGISLVSYYSARRYTLRTCRLPPIWYSRDFTAWRKTPVNLNASSATLHFGKASASKSFPDAVLHRRLDSFPPRQCSTHTQRGRNHPRQSPDRHRKPPSLFMMMHLCCLLSPNYHWVMSCIWECSVLAVVEEAVAPATVADEKKGSQKDQGTDGAGLPL